MKYLKITKIRFLLYLFIFIGSIYSVFNGGFYGMAMYHKLGLILLLIVLLITLTISINQHYKQNK